ncbi:hypothetical protein [Chryseobacterium shigense]|uniref:Peptide zinc metalloprotease protein n=1 Tax=Chryseobacterium shigense TaxID=297244 RepID=A0A841NIK6_9FLAO|nr:hypothetical protein [Chryseobacterium shigense]MBB6371099.1 hypothetical protein [Chryseobacterium shigense]
MSLIRTDYFLSPYQTGKWVLEVSGTHFIINDDTKKLIDILSTSQNYKEAATHFNSDFESNDFSEIEFAGFTEKVFEEIPIFNHSVTETKEPKSFIKFQKELLKPSVAGKTASFITFLFNKKLFWITFSLLVVLQVIIMINTPLSSFTNISPVWVVVIYTSTMFLHELGHIAACRKFTGKNGEIGFGIYFIFPVLYSNISSVWHADKQERVITNLAGIYMQLLCMLILYGIYLLTHDASSLYLAYFIACYCLLQVFPFIRSDGYWLLSDLTSTSNLLQKSESEVKRFITKPFSWLKEKREKKGFLLGYGFFNYAILIYFITTQLIFNWEKILYFPVYIINTIKQIFTFQFDKITFDSGLITVIIFYILVFNYANNFIKNISASPDKKRGH